MATTRIGRQTRKPERYQGSYATTQPFTFTTTHEEDALAHASLFLTTFSAAATLLDTPRTFAEATDNNYATLWQPAIDKEIANHAENGTWEVVPHHKIPPGVKLVGTRWVFDTKQDESGNIVKRKARLVAQGFSQRLGFDYDDTYSPVVRYDSLRILLVLAALHGWQTRQVDFDAAYLNGHLKHRIYCRPPPGLLSNGALFLLKTLYGLKQSGREWYAVLSEWLKSQHFSQANFDPCVFISSDLVLGIYVDNVLMVGTQEQIDTMLCLTKARFRFRDLGRPRMMLGLEIDHFDDHMELHQRTYIAAVLRRYGMTDCNGRHTPIDPSSFPPRTPVDIPVNTDRQKKFQSIIGSLNFIAVVSRPDIAYTIGLLGSYNANPLEGHLKLAFQVLQYVRATSDHQLMIGTRPARQPTQIVMYSDASYASDPDNSKSFSGYILKVNGSVISWSSKRQSCVAQSTCEAEYIAASYAASHLVWARRAIIEFLPVTPLCRLLVNNKPAIALIRDQKLNPRSKHIHVHYHFVRERFLAGDFDIEHVQSGDNLADLCTKALPRPTLEKLDTRISNITDEI